MTDLRKILAFNIKLHRKKLGLSQAQLAETVDVSDNYITLIETCKRFPSVNMLEKLAIALKIDILDLFSVKIIEMSEKKEIKNKILADIDNILNLRLLENKEA
jgi:transcriptional regulator with XRE-family HTH domain